MATVQGGLGVGLTLVKTLAELHGGTVEAHSAGPGHGSEFVVPAGPWNCRARRIGRSARCLRLERSENPPQFRKIQRLDQVMVDADRRRSLAVGLLAPAGQCNDQWSLA